MRKVEEENITIAEVYELLKKNKELNPLQSRVLDYVRKTIKVEDSKAPELVERLIKEFNLEHDRAIQIVNVMPESIEELRIFFIGLKGRLITMSQLKGMLKLLDEYRLPAE